MYLKLQINFSLTFVYCKRNSAYNFWRDITERDKDFLNFIVRLFLDDILERILAYFPDFLFKRKFLAPVRSPAKYSDASGPAKKDPTLDGLLRHKTRSVSK